MRIHFGFLGFFVFEHHNICDMHFDVTRLAGTRFSLTTMKLVMQRLLEVRVQESGARIFRVVTDDNVDVTYHEKVAQDEVE